METMRIFAQVALGALMLLAAVIDARHRRFPNTLALALAGTAALAAWAQDGTGALVHNLMWASLTCGMLIAFELAWRHVHHGAPGIGMGDVKFLFGAMLYTPHAALVSFGLGLAALAVAGVVTHRPSLPALPFIVGAMALLAVVG